MDRIQLDKIISTTQTLIKESGFDCIEAEWVGSERILRLFIDRLESDDAVATPVNLDDCVKATRLLNDSEAFEQAVEGSYTLEVSSPGLERPLRRRSHFEKHLGAKIEVKLTDAFCDRKHAVGELLAISEEADDPQVTMKTNRGDWSFPLAQLQRANLVFEWNNV